MRKSSSVLDSSPANVKTFCLDFKWFWRDRVTWGRSFSRCLVTFLYGKKLERSGVGSQPSKTLFWLEKVVKHSQIKHLKANKGAKRRPGTWEATGWPEHLFPQTEGAFSCVDIVVSELERLESLISYENQLIKNITLVWGAHHLGVKRLFVVEMSWTKCLDRNVLTEMPSGRSSTSQEPGAVMSTHHRHSMERHQAQLGDPLNRWQGWTWRTMKPRIKRFARTRVRGRGAWSSDTRGTWPGSAEVRVGGRLDRPTRPPHRL